MSNEFYVTLREAHAELQRRAHMMPVIEAWWQEQGWEVPAIAHAGSAGIFARQLATFRYEDAIFAYMCRIAGLTPVWMPYALDWFSTNSSLKMCYVLQFLCSGVGRAGGAKLCKKKLVRDIQALVGKRLIDIVVDDGRNLRDLHMELHQKMTGGGCVQDVSHTLQQIGGVHEYYRFDMSLYLAHGVLFEDFHGGESGAKLNSFTTGIFEPAFHEITEQFGMKPLIVRMPWCPAMAYYPADEQWQEHGVMDEILAVLETE